MAADPDEAAGAALVASMASGGRAATVPTDPDEAAGMALVKSLGSVKAEAPQAPQAFTPNDISGEGRDEYGNPLGPLGPAAPREPPPTIGNLRNAMAPTPGYVSMSPLPFALKETFPGSGVADPNSGLAGMKPDLGPLRGIGTGLLDLLEGPSTGTVTPEARNLLAMAAMGGKLTPSVARGTGSAIRDTAELGAPANRLYDPGAPPRTAAEGNLLANHPRPTDLPPENRMAPSPAATPATTTPAPQSVGAAASGRVDMTPAEVDAYRGTAEGDKLIESQQPGKADTNQYVPGVAASTAEIEQTVNAARDAKAANMAHPEVSQASKEQADANNTARQQYFQATSRSPVDVKNAIDARKAMVEKDYPAAFKGAEEADASPVVAEIQAKLDDKRGKQNTQLNTYIKPLIGRLVNEDGSLKITDPQELYGFREDLNRMRSKASQADNPNLTHVSGELGDIIATTDKAIEAAAPGYRNYMDNYAAASRKIDEMQILQEHQAGLFDSQGRMQLSRVQTMMRNIVDSRAADSLNQYQSITPENMQRLWNLRDDLRRSASAQELARTPGSDTAQNFFDLAKSGAVAGGRLVAHGIAHGMAPIAGPIILNAVEGGIANRRAAGAQRRGIAQGLGNLNPNRLVTPQD